MSENSTATEVPEVQTTLEQQTYDYASIRIQTLTVSAILLVLAFLNFWPTLRIGLLQNDFARVDLLRQALNGDWTLFLQQFAPSTRLYEPAAYTSLLIELSVWRNHLTALHITNVLLTFASACLVMLITMEFTGAWANRSRASAAMWAGLLYIVYPLHAEPVSWISERGVLLGSFFSLLSVFLFLRHRLIREHGYLLWSSIFLLLGLLTNKAVLTLPAVLTLAVLLLKVDRLTPANPAKKRLNPLLVELLYTIPLWTIAGLFALVFTATQINDLGIGEFFHTKVTDLRNLLDLSSMARVIAPANDSLHSAKAALLMAPIALGLIGLFAGMRSAFTIGLPRVLIFALGWLTLSVLPYASNWHIQPNLVGSDMFYLASAPLCIAIACGALTSAEASSRKLTAISSWPGLLLLLAVFLSWSYLLQENLKPWRSAAEQVDSAQRQLKEIAAKTVAGKRNLLLDFPDSYQGAPLLGNAKNTEILCRPPCSESNLWDKFVVIDPVLPPLRTNISNTDASMPDAPITNSGGTLDAARLKAAMKNPKIEKAWQWNSGAGDSDSAKFLQFSPPSANGRKDIVLDNFLGAVPSPPSVWTGVSKEWHLGSSNNVGFEIYPKFRRLIASQTGSKKHVPPVMTLLLPVQGIEPWCYSVARLDLKFHGAERDRQKCSFIWQSQGADDKEQTQHQAPIERGQVQLAGQPDWTLGAPPKFVGLRLEPGEYCVDVSEIVLQADQAKP